MIVNQSNLQQLANKRATVVQLDAQVLADIVTTYVHIACITWKALLHGEVDSSKGVSILLDCKQALNKYGYSFALVKQAGVVARKENN